jgi:hypothetical protein
VFVAGQDFGAKDLVFPLSFYCLATVRRRTMLVSACFSRSPCCHFLSGFLRRFFLWAARRFVTRAEFSPARQWISFPEHSFLLEDSYDEFLVWRPTIHSCIARPPVFPLPYRCWFLLLSFYNISAFPAPAAQMPVMFWSIVSALVGSAPFSSVQNFALALLRQFF